MDGLQQALKVAGSSRILLLAIGILSIVIFAARKLLHVHHDPREPPLIPHAIPFIGHVVGMFRYGARYFDIIDQKYNYPIYTLPTMTGRSYIVTSPTLAAIVQRSSKTTSFYSVILEVTKRLVAFDKPTMDIIWQNANREHGDEGIMPESHDMIAGVLGPGPTLNNMSQTQLEIFTETISRIQPEGDETVVELHSWLREQFTMSNAKAIYGPENLFAVHPELVKDFWVFEEGMIPLLADFWPAITARKPYLARKKILDALTEFVEMGRYKKASTLIQRRVSINLKHGLTPKMAGHGELIMLFAIVGNAVPTTFWLLANLFSRPELLVEVRGEIEKAVVATLSEGGKETRTIHVEKLKAVAPVLLSCYRETLRMVANLSSVRWILEDTMVTEKYLLKKDSIVQIASGVIHVDEDIWGPDAGEFNPRRFITTTPEVSFSGPTTEKTATAPLPKNVPSAAFRAFGGGSVICPGRHFAQSEIVGFVAAVLMGFDIEKPGGGTFESPQRDNSKIPLAVMKPAGECMVAISKRKGLENLRWELEL